MTKINSKSLGLAVAITAAFLWSVYSLGVLCLWLLGMFLTAGYANSAGFDWTAYLNKFFAQLIVISFGTGVISWLIGEIYNDLNEIFDVKLK